MVPTALQVLYEVFRFLTTKRLVMRDSTRQILRAWSIEEK